MNELTNKVAVFTVVLLFLLTGVPLVAQSKGPTIWNGDTITFTKADSADPTDASNQDRITENVWITRGNDGGEIYNAAVADDFTKGASPRGTEWAVGRTDELEQLTFTVFREAIGRPQNVVGKELVLHVVESDVYLDVEFTSWSPQKRGGFAYRRSTAE